MVYSYAPESTLYLVDNVMEYAVVFIADYFFHIEEICNGTSTPVSYFMETFRDNIWALNQYEIMIWPGWRDS